jgi:subtilisin family serine protease
MIRLPDWLREWLLAASGSTARSTRARPTFDLLEDRTLLSSSPTTLVPQTWLQQRFTVDDTVVARTALHQSTQTSAAPTNNSFGSLIGLNQVFATTSDRGAGYSVAVIDTGINYNDPNLGGGWGHRVVAGYNFVNNTSDPMDDNGHGTFVAGEIGSSSTTYSGVAPDVNFVALKVLDSTGSGTYANVLSALNWVVAHQAQYNIVAVNLSIGSGNYTANPYTYLETDFATLKSKGVFIAVASGNDYYGNNSQAGLAYPAVSSNVVSVGAVWDGNFGAVAWASGARDNSTAADQIASFTQRSSALSILAPGAIVTGEALKGGYTTMAGTSMATPVIAGAAVLLHEALVDGGLSGDANQNYILNLMRSTGKSIVDSNNGTDNVSHTGLTFRRLNLAAAFAAIPQNGQQPPPTQQPPTLAAIPNQTVAVGHTLSIPLSASDPGGLPLTFSASVAGSGSSQAYQLRTSLGLQFSGSYYTNLMGANEKWISSAGGTWYTLLPNGEFRRWAGNWTATLQPAALIATLGPSFYADPSLLWNSQPAGAPATVAVSNGVLTITPSASFKGSFSVTVTASDGTLSASQSFSVNVVASTTTNTAPTLGAIGNQTVSAGKSLSVSLTASDPNGLPLSFAAAITSGASQAYQLKSSLGLQYIGTYYTNLMGSNEKWLTGTGGTWYCLLSNGELRRWAGSWAATLQPSALVASLGASYYTNPGLLWNAQQTAAPATVTVANGHLVIQPTTTFRGTFTIRVTVSNGKAIATQQFTVTVTA